jgi:hypothetical protein
MSLFSPALCFHSRNRTGQEALDLSHTILPGGKDEFDQLSSQFDSKPLAAASLGHVHRATLRSNGDQVAVKVQRPFLKQIYDQNLALLLLNVAKFIDKLPSKNNNVGGVTSSWTKIFLDARPFCFAKLIIETKPNDGIRRFARDFGLDKGGQPMPCHRRPIGFVCLISMATFPADDSWSWNLFRPSKLPIRPN